MTWSALRASKGIKSDLKPAPTRRRRGHSKQFTVPHCRTDYRKEAFLPRTLRDWNQLPADAAEATTKDMFVSQVSRLE